MNNHEVFWLARYAHNTISPLIKEAQETDPTIRFSIEMRFENANTEFGDGRVSLFAHWGRKEGMFLYSTWNTSKEDIDNAAAQVRRNIDALETVPA
jgi:hypothetical protein